MRRSAGTALAAAVLALAACGTGAGSARSGSAPSGSAASGATASGTAPSGTTASNPAPSGPTASGSTASGAAPSGPLPWPPGEPQTVTVERSGGIAGTQDVVIVRPDGSWRRTAKGGRTAGTLTAGQRAVLTRMEDDRALAGEAGRTPANAGCADGYGFRLTVGGLTVAWQECGSATAPPPVAAGIARMVLDSTG